jgi:glutamine synthetase
LHRDGLIMVCTCEIAGRVRGKAFPAGELPARLVRGVGWVPTNTMISAFGPIHATPFGTTGDLILVPDPQAEVFVDFGDGEAAEHFFLGDLRNTDGSAWECCPREFLRRALLALHEAAGVSLHTAFEHEFAYGGIEDVPGAAFSLDAFRRQGVFGEVLMAAMHAAGLSPDSFLPEYGPRQFEVTCGPQPGLRAADHAVVLREMVRATAHRLGHSAGFAPILDPASVGNGVHVHMSFRDADGMPVMHDPAGFLGLSAVAQHFMAGILHHLPALCAVTAPSAVSYIRMRPNRWAPTHATLADRDRGASLRVCPVLNLPGTHASAQFNVEYRPADAAASPYLALGAIVSAGVDGIRRGLELPGTEAPALPGSLGAALDALEATPQAAEWFGATYLSAYLMFKRGELASLAGLDEAAQCALYARVY